MITSLPLSVSVVVPTYKRPDLLARCLDALLHQTMPTEAYEIIVCDDDPSADVEGQVRRLSAESGGLPLMRYMPVVATQGPSGARNTGWRSAKAAIIAFTDDDTIPDSRWLQAGVQALSTGAAAAVGRIIMPVPVNPSDYEKDAARLQDAEFVTANCFVRREALELVGGFDEEFTLAWREDSDLHFSLLKKGCRIVSAPLAIVTHPLRPARFAAGLGMQKKVMFDVLLYRKHPDLYRQRIRKRPPWFYLSITACLLVAVSALVAGWGTTAEVAICLWAALSLAFFIYRLAGSSFALRNVVDLFLTSVLIPPLSIFWRLVGVARFGRGMP